MCAGAGLSMADNSTLPDGPSLSADLDRKLSNVLSGYQPPVDTSDLLTVADAGLNATGTLEAIQKLVRDSADFLGAPSNYGHEAVAVLLAEGAIRMLLLWNWDTCIERVDLPGEQLDVAFSYDDLEQLQSAPVAKVHGCATRWSTMLISSSQLSDPKMWAVPALSAALQTATAVFVGVGDVADYAEWRLRELHEDFPHLDVRLVSPHIVSGWDASTWSDLLPELEEERKFELSADVFLDELCRAWAMQLVLILHSYADEVEEDDAAAVRRVADAVQSLDAITAVRWCRSAALRRRSGQSYVQAEEMKQVLLAVAALSRPGSSSIDVEPDARCHIGDDTYEVLVATETPPSREVVLEAYQRAIRMNAQGRLDGSAQFLISGQTIGPLASAVQNELNVIDGVVEATDILDGVERVDLKFLTTSEVLEDFG
jgi:hypothetical protein